MKNNMYAVSDDERRIIALIEEYLKAGNSFVVLFDFVSQKCRAVTGYSVRMFSGKSGRAYSPVMLITSLLVIENEETKKYPIGPFNNGCPPSQLECFSRKKCECMCGDECPNLYKKSSNIWRHEVNDGK